MSTITVEPEYGCTVYINEAGQFHREDGPAVEAPMENGVYVWAEPIKARLRNPPFVSIDQLVGNQEWWINGKRHREGGPAFISDDGEVWFYEGIFHRIGGPAITYSNGHKVWYQYGKLHRNDGPAVVHTNGYEEWWLAGKRHRANGPAVTWPSGKQDWWFEGEKITAPQEISRLKKGKQRSKKGLR